MELFIQCSPLVGILPGSWGLLCFLQIIISPVPAKIPLRQSFCISSFFSFPLSLSLLLYKSRHNLEVAVLNFIFFLCLRKGLVGVLLCWLAYRFGFLLMSEVADGVVAFFT